MLSSRTVTRGSEPGLVGVLASPREGGDRPEWVSQELEEEPFRMWEQACASPSECSSGEGRGTGPR